MTSESIPFSNTKIKLLFPKQPYKSPLRPRAYDARKPIKPRQNWLSKWLTEKKALGTIGVFFLGSVAAYIIAGNILPGALA